MEKGMRPATAVSNNGPQIDIGIQPAQRKAIADGLSRVLADTYTLYLKTHYFHWNVTGPMFQTLHLMFELQYNELALAVDLVAERIRAWGIQLQVATPSSQSFPPLLRKRTCPGQKT